LIFVFDSSEFVRFGILLIRTLGFSDPVEALGMQYKGFIDSAVDQLIVKKTLLKAYLLEIDCCASGHSWCGVSFPSSPTLCSEPFNLSLGMPLSCFFKTLPRLLDRFYCGVTRGSLKGYSYAMAKAPFCWRNL
jgi:hypothetical protein